MKVQAKIVVASLFVLLVALALNSVLSLASFEDIYSSSLVSIYETSGKNLKRKIEQSLRFGKPLDKFKGINLLLSEVIEKNSGIASVGIGRPEGEILYHTDSQRIGEQFRFFPSEWEDSQVSITKLRNGMYYTYLPIFGRQDNLTGIIQITFSQELIYQRVTQMGLENLEKLGYITAVASLLLVVFLAFFTRGMAPEDARLRIFILGMGIIVGAQLAYSYFNIQQFQRSHLQTVQEKFQRLAGFLKDDVEYVLNLNIPLGELVKLERTLSDILKVTPELAFIEIADLEGHVLYFADHETMKQMAPGERDAAASPDTVLPVLYQRENERVGTIQMKMLTKVISQKSREILLDMLTAIMVSLLITFEAFSFALNRSMDMEEEEENPNRPRDSIPYSYIRPVIFLFIIADGFCVSFFPLFADTFYEPMWGLSREVLMGLPISVFMLSVVFSMVLGGNWSDRVGWYKPLVFGVVVNGIGLLLTAFTQNMIQLLVFRCFTAIGFGVVFISGQRFVAENTTSENRSVGMASFLSAFFGGSICGTVIGGMLADRIGYRNVFLLAGLVSFAAFIACLYIFKNQPRKPQATNAVPFSFRQLFEALKDKEFISVVFLQAIPAKLILIGCLFYLVPLYLKSLDVLQSDIGRVILVYDLVIISLGHFFSRFFDNVHNRKFYIFTGGMITGLSMILFQLSSGFIATLLLVAAIGLSHTFSISSQVAVITETSVIQRIGVGTGMGIFRFWERLGNVAGPLVVGFLIVSLGYIQTVVALGIVSVVCSLLYLATVLLPKFGEGE